MANRANYHSVYICRLTENVKEDKGQKMIQNLIFSKLRSVH